MTRQCRAALEHPYEPGHDRCKLDEGHTGVHTCYGGRGIWTDEHARHIEVPLDEDEVVERIVEWLRAGGENGPSATERYLADAIERREWKAPPNESEGQP